MTVSAGRPRRVLIIVENLPVPFDRRVWQEATTLARAGYEVSVICPTGRGYERSFEILENVHIYRHSLPIEATGAFGYLSEYLVALVMELWLSLRVLFRRGFDVIHACNPPDLIFLVALPFVWLGRKRFLFDHHDLNPELFEAKFHHRGPLYRLMVWLEKRTFGLADVSIATNNSYRQIAIERGGMRPERVFVVRSGPSLERLVRHPPVPKWRNGRKYLVGYVGTMGAQEGIDLLLAAVKHIVFERKRSDIQFALVGGGGVSEEMEALSRKIGVADYVTFTGRVPDAELLEVLNTADVCVNPDPYTEMNDKSTMNKIMEYMSLGKPIVQFDLAEGRFSAGDASLYARRDDSADLADKLLELIDDPARRSEMGCRGRERVERELAWTHESPKLLAAYDALFAPSSHGGAP
jgi:glycosyltransferase involved in cell wall biosynthesis